MNTITCENCRQIYNTSEAFCPNCAQANRYYEKPTIQEPSYPRVSTITSTSSSSTPGPSVTSVPSTEGDTSIYWIIGFLFWFVGIILYFAMINRYPKAAQSALNGSLTIIVIGIIIAFLANI
jgi:hypothetical protein